MTVQFGSEVFIGCVDIAGCGASIINSIDAPSAPLELACLANVPSTPPMGVSGAPSACSVKHVGTPNGQVSFISINAEPTADVPATVVAHELVSFLRDSGVEFVGVIGSAHLATAVPGQVYYCNPCASKGQTQSPAVSEIQKIATKLPDGTELKDEMLASLYTWLQAAAMPSMMCLVQGHRASSTGVSKNVDIESFGGLVNLPSAVSSASLDKGHLLGTKLLTASPQTAGRVDSLMYM